MDKELTYKGNTYSVSIDNANSDNPKVHTYTAKVGDNKYQLDLARVSANCFSISFDGITRTVHIAESDDSVFVHMDGRVIRFDKVSNDAKKFSADGLGFGAKDEINTPMPGKIVKLLVSDGERVEAGQPLVIVESMKMENEIKSPTNGVVKSIHFSAGDLVEPDKPIIKLEPDN